MHFAIIEDLKMDMDNLTSLIDEDCAIHGDEVEFSKYTNAEDFLADFHRGFCSAIFLDIMLGDGMNGIKAAQKVREQDSEIPMIFTTTERDFALESYDVHALGYLVKPVQPEKLSWCMNQLRNALAVPEYLEIKGTVNESGNTLSVQYVLLDDITDTETVRRGCILHTAKGDIFTPQSHTELMKSLPHTGRFCEYGRGMCVSFSHVSSMSENGTIALKDGRKLYCSRRKIKETLDCYRKYEFSMLRKRGV
ncbi:MAG: LytTR family DNA-binding domain-containing protein [Lachnospiraceae bacterium]|nr:LytTR family DNA-binding domain-containing protein [Lachnospiraceae bacterium]